MLDEAKHLALYRDGINQILRGVYPELYKCRFFASLRMTAKGSG